VAAPLRSVSAKQIGAIVPFAVVPGGTTQVRVEYQGVLSNPLTIATAPSAPAVFTVDGSGQGQGVIANPDGTPNSADAPAAPLDIVNVLMTGAGQTDPPGVDGQVASDAPVGELSVPATATIGGLNATVVSARPAPNMVAGMVLIQVEVPPDVTADNAAPLVITVGATSSPAVTLAVSAGKAESQNPLRANRRRPKTESSGTNRAQTKSVPNSEASESR
jgi:uncharacterized protein (TIGR03437 family)